MKNRKIGVIVLVFLVSTMAGCGHSGKFMKTQSEDLAPFADQTISMVADIAQGIEAAQTIQVSKFIDWEAPDVKEYVRLREQINDLFRGIVLYSIDIVTISEAQMSGAEKCAALARYLERIDKPLEEQTDVEILLTSQQFNEMLNNIRAQDRLLDGLAAAQPLINEVSRYGDEILDKMRFLILRVDKELSAAIDARFGHLTDLGTSLMDKQRLLTEAQEYVWAYKKGDRQALDKLRQMEVVGVKTEIPPGRLTWKQIDKIDQFILNRIVQVQEIAKANEFTLGVYVNTHRELDKAVGGRLSQLRTGRLFLFTWARAHHKMALGKTNPAEWFDIVEAPAKLLAVGAKAVF